jgi:hypothetical protein
MLDRAELALLKVVQRRLRTIVATPVERWTSVSPTSHWETMIDQSQNEAE